MARANLDYNRRSGLVESGAVSREELSTVRNALDSARSALAVAQQALAAQQVQVAESDASQNPEVRARQGRRWTDAGSICDEPRSARRSTASWRRAAPRSANGCTVGMALMTWCR